MSEHEDIPLPRKVVKKKNKNEDGSNTKKSVSAAASKAGNNYACRQTDVCYMVRGYCG